MKWYKQDRNVFDRAWAKDSKMVAIYLYLHCIAYVTDGMYHGMLVRRGSCVTSRAAIMEATGLSEREVKTRLRNLLDNGEIIVKTSNLCSIITICDYGGYDSQEDLFEFEASSQVPSQVTPQVPSQRPTNTYLINKKEEYKNLRSNNIPSKMEREKREALSKEIKDLYNRSFDGLLPEWKRLTLPMVEKIDICIARYGRQAVDMVFEQVHHEKFHLGHNDTGFITDFRFIFRLENFEAYLSRYKLRIQKGRKDESESASSVQGVAWTTTLPQQLTASEKAEKRKENLLGYIAIVQKNPKSYCKEILNKAYNNGELQELGIQWKPNNI